MKVTTYLHLLKRRPVNRTVIITGSASGIGRATVEKFAAEGWNVIATVRKDADLKVHEGHVMEITLRVDGEHRRLTVDPRITLLDVLRDRLGVTSPKKGCDHGQCGACTIHINGRRVNSCLALAAAHVGDEIVTIEGLGVPGRLHPMQAAFLDNDAYQCGYCTSGQIMSAVALLREPCGMSDDDVREFMSGNICRCGAYPNIVKAIQQARRALRGS